MSDGSRLRQSWATALNDAEVRFRQLLTSSSNEWKRVPQAGEASLAKKGKAKVSALPELSDVVVHRKPGKAGDDIYRLVLDVSISEELVSLEPWKAVLTTPELRQEWDPAVEEAHLLELFDRTTRISKTNFTLGWPANPRDAVTISRSYHDATTVIDITTSLPRSPDEPAYLRPSPPYVRSHVPLFAWCIQHIQPQPASNVPSDTYKKRSSPGGKIRMTCFWQHDLKALWGFGTSSNLTQQLSTMTLGLLKTVLKRGNHVPKLTGYGSGVSIERIRFQIDREALTIDYAIIPEDEDHPALPEGAHGMDEVHAIREHRRLKRSIECVLPSSEGWDVRVTTKASSEEVEKLPWSAHAIRSTSVPSASQHSSIPPDQIVLRLSHAALIDDHSVLKVRVVIEVSGPSSGLRLNGIPQPIQDVEYRDPSSYFISEQILQDVSSAVDLSFNTTSSFGTANTNTSTESAQTLVRQPTERTPAADKSVLSRPNGDGQLRVGESLSLNLTPLILRAKIYWDKQHEDAVLLEDVNELTELWHYKTRPAWPVNGRDAVVLRTVYKSPTTIHVFSFSAEDSHLFPNIPAVEPNVIRTQVDLQGWAIEALSPTTTLLTLLEQSDPKGWTNKTSIPQQMINLLAGIGEFAIKCGGPPVLTRLAGAKVNELRYDHERSSFRVEYEASASRRAMNNVNASEGEPSASPVIECEIRCDIDTWAPSLDIVVDPPPQSISCLRRHRLSIEGGGLWISLTHDGMFVDDDRLLVIVRRAPGKERGLVMVNGAKVPVDVEEIPEHEIKMLTKQKRVKPPRIPLDQPPVMSVIRRRRAEWDADSEGSGASGTDVNPSGSSLSTWASAPRISSPLTRFWNYAVDQATATTQQAVAAISPAAALASAAIPSPTKAPMQYALDALAWTQETHALFPSTGWELVSEKGLPVHKKLAPEICSVIPVHKGFKVIEGVSAEELAAVITEPDCRKKWDDRYDSSCVLESFGGKSRTSFVVSKTGFPWRDRGFYVASVMARAFAPPSVSRSSTATGEVAEQSNGVRNAIFYVSTSFSPESVASFAASKYNSYALPIGRVYLDAWILETLDPYTKENYAIPSTRCTRLVAVDYAGAIPAAVNSMINATLPRSILAVEAYIKGLSQHPITRLPAPGLVITEKKVEGHLATTAWKLRKRDENRVLLNTTYTSEDRVYTSTILVTPPVTSSPTSPPHLASSTVAQLQSILHAPANPALSDTTATPGLPTPMLSSSPPAASPPASLRQRTMSASGPPSVSTSYVRGRTTSSAFTPKGEVRPPTDLIVCEIVIDSKLYPEGCDVSLRSRMRSGWKVGPNGEYVSLRSLPSQPTSSTSTATTTTNGSTSTTTPAPAVPAENVLPLAYTIHTMPSSPLHSSGLNEGESPTRHLLRLSLPTAQYQISTVRDPLTGETRSAPPIPGWLAEMREGGAIVEVEVRPRKDGARAAGKGKVKVRVDGKDLVVADEKESLTSLGREELLDDRVSKMGVLSRIPSEAEPLPEELKVPVAIADDLLDPVSTSLTAPDPSNLVVETVAIPETGEGTLSNDAHQQAPPPPPTLTPHVPRVASGGLLGFLQAYDNPLARFTTAGTTSMTVTKSNNTITSGNAATITTADTAAGALATPATPPRKLPGGLGDLDTAAAILNTTNGGTRRQYPLSTVLVVALIAFLIGSLLRSLLSPADFIYFVTDLKDAEEASSGGGWREIRRLLEVKYLVGGWDFQVAVVAWWEKKWWSASELWTNDCRQVAKIGSADEFEMDLPPYQPLSSLHPPTSSPARRRRFQRPPPPPGRRLCNIYPPSPPPAVYLVYFTPSRFGT
ncbi:putative START domain containing protein [Lyophyllum shimeji]|uniref:START domain containing protein n=1 Tax=Lyophyllum shimeji TaxID=47721 RepID=A0A9P3USV6_LYOSH|nr:putative START domain containing protein [Lyophyllum shimeji]